MKIPTIDSTDLSDAHVRQKTGKTLPQWYARIDSLGGLTLGRRDLVQALHAELDQDEYWAVTLAVEYEKARGQKEKDGRPRGYSICATKTLGAPLSAVWRAWTQGQELDRWLGPKTALELKEGGTLANADGDRWTLGRIREGKDLRFTWERAGCAEGSAVEVLFAAKPKDRAGITLNHTRIQERKAADELRAAWGEALERLKGVLEG